MDLPNQSFKHIYWLDPQKKEPLPTYAARLIEQIDTSKPVVLVGVSFGGMIAQEIAKHISVQQLIIISSVKSPDEFDWKLKIARKTKLHLLAPTPLLKWGNLLTANYFFSVTDKQEAALLRQIVLDTDTKFMLWAIDAIMNWQNPEPLPNIIHIHGTTDRIFPVKPIKNAHLIKGGGHFMIVNKAVEVSELIMKSMNNRL